MKPNGFLLIFLGGAALIGALGGGYHLLKSQGQADSTDPVAELKKLSADMGADAAKPAKANPHKSKGAHGKGNPHGALGPDKLVLVALQHLGEGRPKEALKTLDDGLMRYPDSPKMLGVRGTIHLQAKRVADALNDFEAAVQIAPDDVLLLVNRAQAYRQFGREKAALEDLDKAIKLKPDFVAARFNRGAILLNQRKHEDARKDFEHCIAVDPHAPAPYFNLAITLDGLNKRDEAIAEMKRFMKVAKQESWREVAKKQLAVWENPEGAQENHKAADASGANGKPAKKEN